MPFERFLLWSSLGAAIWCSLLFGAGYLLGDYGRSIDRWLNPIVDIVIAACVVTYLVQVARYQPHEAKVE